jgi:hypothetical protein
MNQLQLIKLILENKVSVERPTIKLSYQTKVDQHRITMEVDNNNLTAERELLTRDDKTAVKT